MRLLCAEKQGKKEKKEGKKQKKVSMEWKISKKLSLWFEKNQKEWKRGWKRIIVKKILVIAQYLYTYEKLYDKNIYRATIKKWFSKREDEKNKS